MYLVVQSGSYPYYSGVIIGAIASQITSLTIVYSAVYSGTDKKHQSFGHWPLWGELSGDRWSNAENVSICWRHGATDFTESCRTNWRRKSIPTKTITSNITSISPVTTKRTKLNTLVNPNVSCKSFFLSLLTLLVLTHPIVFSITPLFTSILVCYLSLWRCQEFHLFLYTYCKCRMRIW